ncbi:hypothetical protein CC78DRAFT_621205 [Lojkania enalia]|uniref:Uncharacterized protein n=1 Tax=Lojkania enalia TaxID=147567 RepID=A0A9P4K4C9_9PLEO|nr:hypothetical protein CC78DRAFT_621205 [Didymosphaeria enalia]
MASRPSTCSTIKGKPSASIKASSYAPSVARTWQWTSAVAGSQGNSLRIVTLFLLGWFSVSFLLPISQCLRSPSIRFNGLGIIYVALQLGIATFIWFRPWIVNPDRPLSLVPAASAISRNDEVIETAKSISYRVSPNSFAGLHLNGTTFLVIQVLVLPLHHGSIAKVSEVPLKPRPGSLSSTGACGMGKGLDVLNLLSIHQLRGLNAEPSPEENRYLEPSNLFPSYRNGSISSSLNTNPSKLLPTNAHRSKAPQPPELLPLSYRPSPTRLHHLPPLAPPT